MELAWGLFHEEPSSLSATLQVAKTSVAGKLSQFPYFDHFG
jgi:hypothetical protein